MTPCLLDIWGDCIRYVIEGSRKLSVRPTEAFLENPQRVLGFEERIGSVIALIKLLMQCDY